MTLNQEFFAGYFEEHPESNLFAMYAQELHNNGETTRAVELCKAGTQQYPEMISGWLVYGEILSEQGDVGQAAECYQKALELDPLCLSAAEILLTDANLSVDPRGIRLAAESLLQINPEHEIAVQRLEALESMPEIDESLQEVDNADLQVDPGDTEVQELEDELGVAVEEPEETAAEDQGQEVPSLQSDEQVIQDLFTEAMKDEPAFVPPEFTPDVGNESETSGELLDDLSKPEEEIPAGTEEQSPEDSPDESDANLIDFDEFDLDEPEPVVPEVNESVEDEIQASFDEEAFSDIQFEDEELIAEDQEEEQAPVPENEPDDPAVDFMDFEDTEESEYLSDMPDEFSTSEIAEEVEEPEETESPDQSAVEQNESHEAARDFTSEADDPFAQALPKKIHHEDSEEVSTQRDLRKQIPFTHPFQDPGEDNLSDIGSGELDETETGDLDEISLEKALRKKYQMDEDDTVDSVENFQSEPDEIPSPIQPGIPAEEPDEEELENFDIFDADEEDIESVIGKMDDQSELAGEPEVQQEDPFAAEPRPEERGKTQEELEKEAEDLLAELTASEIGETEESPEESTPEFFDDGDDDVNEFRLNSEEVENVAKGFNTDFTEAPESPDIDTEDAFEDDLYAEITDEIEEIEAPADQDEDTDIIESPVPDAGEDLPDTGETTPNEYTAGNDKTTETGHDSMLFQTGDHAADIEQSRAPEQDDLKISPRMATFTFANVLKSQGLYEKAYQVLELMREKSSNIDRIEEEQEALKQLMNKRADNSDD